MLVRSFVVFCEDFGSRTLCAGVHIGDSGIIINDEERSGLSNSGMITVGALYVVVIEKDEQDVTFIHLQWIIPSANPHCSATSLFPRSSEPALSTRIRLTNNHVHGVIEDAAPCIRIERILQLYSDRGT